MEYRRLGRSGLVVSALSLGTMTFGGDAAVRGVDARTAREILDVALEGGVNLVDTADAYSAGESESIIGQVLGAAERDQLILATKVRFPSTDDPNEAGLSRRHIIASCEASLRRLRTDRIDLYQLHGWDGWTDPEETWRALDQLVIQGKVREVGCSNFSGWHVMKSLWASDRVGGPRMTAHQLYYSLIGRDADAELLPSAIDADLGVLVWSPLAGGLLTGKYRRDQEWPAGARHAGDWDEPPIDDWEHVYDVIETVVKVAADRDVHPAHVSLAYALQRPGVSSVIVGARSAEQLRTTLGASDLQLSVEELHALDDISSTALRYPYWHQRRTLGDRLSQPDRVALGVEG